MIEKFIDFFCGCSHCYVSDVYFCFFLSPFFVDFFICQNFFIWSVAGYCRVPFCTFFTLFNLIYWEWCIFLFSASLLAVLCSVVSCIWLSLWYWEEGFSTTVELVTFFWILLFLLFPVFSITAEFTAVCLFSLEC